MTKIWELNILVETKNGLPISFIWRQEKYETLQIIEQWKDIGSWWLGEGEKIFYRLETLDKGLWEIFYDIKEKKWFLYKSYD
ncbi:MAG: hypothetical protein APF76_13290 [Desulfitibacter sp. BRH_c19]|nr:MAG: hypothetical protein APF76_13290 [Desulfitibacter sp. BRH_c19]